jgi:uncharacterized membrane protein
MPLIVHLTHLTLIALGLPLWLRTVPPNGWYGLRVPATEGDEAVWYEANAACGRDFVLLGVALTGVTAALQALGLRPLVLTMAWVGLLSVGVLGVAIVGWQRARRLRDEREAAREGEASAG